MTKSHFLEASPQPNDIVIMDKLPAHKVAGMQDSIEAAAGRLLYLPSYSPDFSLIEQAFAELKALLRSAAARTIPDHWAAIRHAFTRFTPQGCRNYLAAAGYERLSCHARLGTDLGL